MHNTQQTQEKRLHALCRIRNHHPSNRAALDSTTTEIAYGLVWLLRLLLVTYLTRSSFVQRAVKIWLPRSKTQSLMNEQNTEFLSSV